MPRRRPDSPGTDASWQGPPWKVGWHGPPGRGPWGRGWHRPPRRRWGLRRRLNFSFAFVALAAVVLTAWMTVGAVIRSQEELFAATPATVETASEPDATRFPGFGPRDDDDDHDSGGPDWRNDPRFAGVASAVREITRTAVFAGFLAFLLASGAAAAVTRVLTRPLDALTDGARRLAAGERGLRLKPPRARDELRTLTEAFNHLAEGLERQEAWRRDLVADVAHDLRTPLAVLRSEIEAMQDGVARPDAAGMARLHGEVLALTRLVEDLRTLSLAEGGGLELRPDVGDVGELLRRAAAAFATRAADAGVELAVDAPASGPRARFDAAGLTRILNNLLDNALRYAAPGTVELAVASEVDEDPRENVRIEIRDRGPGLSDEALERAFERFYRGDRARRRGGSGLGLAIARALAEAQDGALDDRNRDGGGAVFTVTLPAGRREERPGPGNV